MPPEHLRDNGLRGDVVLNGWWELQKNSEAGALERARVPTISPQSKTGTEHQLRREFLLPEGWKDRELILEIGNLNGGGKLFLNDGLLGEIAPSNAATRFAEFPIPRELLREGAQELRAQTDAIGDDVWLRAFPRSPTRVTDSYIIPSTREMRVWLELEGRAAPGSRVTARAHIFSDAAAKEPVNSLSPQIIDVDAQGQWRGTLGEDWADPKLWSPWSPNLYWYTVELLDSEGTLVDQVLPRRFGFREVWVENRQFMLNGHPLYFNGDTWSRTLNDRTQMHEQLVATMRLFHGVGLIGVARLTSDTAFAAADEAGVFIAQGYVGGLDVPLAVAPVLKQNEAGDAGGDADFTGGDRDRYHASRERMARSIRRWREHPSILTWSIRSPWSRITLDSTRQGLSDDAWKFWPGNRDEAAVENNRRRALVASQTAEFVRSVDPHRPISAQNSPDVEVEFATRYLCDNLDLQEREMFFVHYMTNASDKVLMPSEAGMPFPGHQVLRRQPHQMPQGHNYPAIHLENAARLFGDSVYADEPAERFLLWHRREYIWHKESPVYQRLTAENARQVWRGWRAAGVNALAHWVLREGFANATERADVAERLGIPAEVDPRRPGRSVVGGRPSRESFPLPGVDHELAGGRAYLEGVAPLTAWIGGGPGIRVFNKDHLFTAGRPVRKTITVLNDFHETVALNGEWQLVRSADNSVAESGPLRGEVAPGARALDAFVLAFEAPSVEARTEFYLSFRLESEKGELREEFAITVFPETPLRMQKTTRRVWLLGEDRDGWVRALDLNATRLTLETPPGTVRPDDVVIVPRNALSPELWRHHGLDATIDAGLRVLVLEQDQENILGLRTETVRPRRVFIAAQGHPVLEGFSDGDFRFWTGASDLQPDVPERNTPDIRRFPDRLWKVSNENAVATRTLLRPQRGAARALLVSGFDLQETPLLEVVRGRGRMLFCQLDVSNRFSTDPVASRLLIRLVAYADTAAPPDPARSEVTVVATDHPSVEVVAPFYRAEPPTGPAGWGVTRAELFFRESIYENDWITRQVPVLPIPVFAGGERDVVRALPDGRLATSLHPDLFSTGWGRHKMLFLHSALRINQGGSSSEGPGLDLHGNPTALYPESWRSGFVHPYTAACW